MTWHELVVKWPRCAAKKLQDSFYINLGIGLPILVTNHMPPEIEVWL